MRGNIADSSPCQPVNYLNDSALACTYVMVAHVAKLLRLWDDKTVNHDAADDRQRQADNNRIMKYEGDVFYDLEGYF